MGDSKLSVKSYQQLDGSFVVLPRNFGSLCHGVVIKDGRITHLIARDGDFRLLNVLTEEENPHAFLQYATNNAEPLNLSAKHDNEHLFSIALVNPILATDYIRNSFDVWHEIHTQNVDPEDAIQSIALRHFNPPEHIWVHSVNTDPRVFLDEISKVSGIKEEKRPVVKKLTPETLSAELVKAFNDTLFGDFRITWDEIASDVHAIKNGKPDRNADLAIRTLVKAAIRSRVPPDLAERFRDSGNQSNDNDMSYELSRFADKLDKESGGSHKARHLGHDIMSAVYSAVNRAQGINYC
jgi:hypothetical protein